MLETTAFAAHLQAKNLSWNALETLPRRRATDERELNRSRQSLNMTVTTATLEKTSPFELWRAHAPAFTLRLFLFPGLFHIKREGKSDPDGRPGFLLCPALNSPADTVTTLEAKSRSVMTTHDVVLLD